MLPAISALWSYLVGHKRRHDVLDQTIDALEQSDEEMERRLRVLRDQVDVYQRSQRPEDAAGV